MKCDGGSGRLAGPASLRRAALLYILREASATGVPALNLHAAFGGDVDLVVDELRQRGHVIQRDGELVRLQEATR